MSRFQKTMAGWVLAVVVFLFFCMAPLGLAQKDARVLGVILFTVILWIFEPVPAYVSTLLLIPLLFLIGVPPVEALTGFSDPTWIFVVSVFIFGIAVQSSGIGRRIALFLLARVSSSYNGLVLGFLLVGLVLTLIIPSAVLKSAILLPIAMSIARQMGEKENEPGMAGLTLSVIFAGWTTAGLLPTGAIANLILLGIITNTLPQYAYYTTYVGWMLLIGGLSLLVVLFTWVILIRLFQPKSARASKDVVFEEMKKLPPHLTRDEWRIAIIALLAVVFWSTSNLTGIPTWVTGVLVAALIATPGIGILSANDLKKLDWPTIVWMGGILTIANLMNHYSIAGWLASCLIPILKPFSWNIYLLGLVITVAFLVLSVFIVNAYILAAVLLPPLVSLSSSFGINPMLFVALFLFLFRFFIFPYQCQPAVIIYGMAQGEGCTLYQISQAAFIQAVCAVPMALVAIFYWKSIGII